MRPLLLVLLAACAHEDAASKKVFQPTSPQEQPFRPLKLRHVTTPGRAYEAALRSLVAHGFAIEFADPMSRTIRATNTSSDPYGTYDFDHERRRIYGQLDDGAIRVLRSRGDPESRQLLRGGVHIMRRLHVAIAIGDEAVLRASIQSCLEFEGVERWSPERQELRAYEAVLVDEIGVAFENESGEDHAPKPAAAPATDM